MNFKDNSVISSVDDFINTYPNLSNKLRDRTLKELAEQEDIIVFPQGLDSNRGLRSDMMMFETKDNRILTSNLIGILGFENESLIIKSRFSSSNNDYFLHYLLSEVLDINFIDLETGIDVNEKIYQFLEYVFPKYLNNALRKGLYKEYETMSYNDINVRGSIDIGSHIKKNAFYTGAIAYSTREFKYDNSMTQLIRHTLEMLRSNHSILNRPSTQDVVTRNSIEQIIAATSSYSLSNRSKVISNNINKPIVHSYFYEYRILQNICLMILRNQKHGIHQNNHKVNGIIFDISWLWEEYINTLVGDSFIHPQNSKKTFKQYLFKNSNNNYVGTIYPDFIGINEYENTIADAKYKPFNNIAASDYHQVLSYMYRFNRNTGILIYPTTTTDASNSYSNLRLLDGFNENTKNRVEAISVIKLGLSIVQNQVDNYSSYCALMRLNEKTFLSTLASIAKDD